MASFTTCTTACVCHQDIKPLSQVNRSLPSDFKHSSNSQSVNRGLDFATSVPINQATACKSLKQLPEGLSLLQRCAAPELSIDVPEFPFQGVSTGTLLVREV